MRITQRSRHALAAGIGLAALLAANAAMAQQDFSGYWEPLIHEDARYRGGEGAHKGDYSGIPLNAEGRRVADAWDPDEYYLPELQCAPHGAAYIMRGPVRFHLDYEDDDTLLMRMELQEQERRFYFDGREWPGGDLEWQGHSTARWDGETLTVVTTHMRPRYLRRNGVPHSENAVMTEHYVRHGDYLTVIAIVEDPQFLTAPFVRSSTFARTEPFEFIPYPCEPIIWPNGVPGV